MKYDSYNPVNLWFISQELYYLVNNNRRLLNMTYRKITYGQLEHNESDCYIPFTRWS